MRYTLTVNRANLDNLPTLTLPDRGTVVNEGDTYRAAGRITIPNDLVWTGTADYGDGSGEKALTLKADNSFVLDHQYLDNGQHKVSVIFRYKDLGLVTGSLDISVQNVAPTLIGVQDEYTTEEGSPLIITGNIVDPGPSGHDSWKVSGDYGSEWGPTPGTVNVDKSFILQNTYYDLKPEYDLVLKVVDKDGGSFSKLIKIKVENVNPTVQASGPALVQVGTAFVGDGSFKDPGLDKWQATVDYGDGSDPQPLTLNYQKTFTLNHIYLKTGSFTVTVRVEDQDGGIGSTSFPVKVKDYLFILKAGEDASLNEGDKLERYVPVQGWPNKIKSITVDYGDGAGEEPVALSSKKLTAPSMADQAAQAVQSEQATSVEKLGVPVLPQAGLIPLQHIYADNGTYTVKVKIIDVDGDSYEDSFLAKVANVPPSVKLESIPGMYKGSSFTCHGSITDPGADTWTVEVYYKDGSAPDKINLNSDKTFSFSHSYNISGNFEIEVVVSDDDGGVGFANQQVQVIVPSGGGGGSTHDASLHSILFAGPIVLNPIFNPQCMNYNFTVTGAPTITPTTITVGYGATVKYTTGGPMQDLPVDPNTLSATFLFDPISDLTIVVTAADTVTTHTYIFDSV